MEYFEMLAMFALTGTILVAIPLVIIKLMMKASALPPGFGKEVKISFQENSLLFWWSWTLRDTDSTFQHIRETRIIMDYSVIRHITYNRTFERLEVYGDFEHQRRESNWYDGKTGQPTEWSEWKDNKDADYFVKYKGEKVLYIYNYFDNMQELMDTLKRVSSQDIIESIG